MTRIWCSTAATPLALCLFLIAFTFTAPAYADDIRDSEWHLKSLDAAGAQQLSDGAGVVVGILDTGVDANHRDLANTVLTGRDMIGNTDGRQDIVGHGTRMAGLVAAHGSDGNGVFGIAPGVKILPVRISIEAPDSVDLPYPDGGFAWAARHGARIICASFSTSNTPALRADIQAALDADVVIIAAAGNKTVSPTMAFPAALPGVLAVGGIGQDAKHDPGSISDDRILLSAPSVHIVSTTKHDAYSVATGTSDAAAIVAGVAALVRAKFPTMSAAEVIHRLTATATDKGPPGRDPDFGYGIVNPVAALTADVPPLSPSPSPAPPTTAAAQEASPTGLSTGTIAVLGLALLALAAAGLSVAVLRYRRPR